MQKYLLTIQLYLPVRFDCIHARTHIEQKHEDPFKQRDSHSKRVNCPFHINIRSPKALMGIWRITTINYAHNHELNADTAIFAQEKLKMTPEMLQRVNFYSEAKLGLANTLKLLQNEWQDQIFMPCHVTNAIQTASQTPPTDISQVAQLLLLLTKEKAKDNRWTIRWEADHSNGQL